MKGHFSDTQKIPEEVNLLFSGEYLMQGKLLVYMSVERTELTISTMSQYKFKVYFMALLRWGSPDGPDICSFVSAFLTAKTDHCLMKCSVKLRPTTVCWEPVANSRGEYHPPTWSLLVELGCCSGTGCGTLLEVLEEGNFLYVL